MGLLTNSYGGLRGSVKAAFVAAAAAGIYAFFGQHSIDEREIGLQKRFGKYTEIETAGWNWRWPGLDTVDRVPTLGQIAEINFDASQPLLSKDQQVVLGPLRIVYQIDGKNEEGIRNLARYLNTQHLAERTYPIDALFEVLGHEAANNALSNTDALELSTVYANVDAEVQKELEAIIEQLALPATILSVNSNGLHLNENGQKIAAELMLENARREVIRLRGENINAEGVLRTKQAELAAKIYRAASGLSPEEPIPESDAIYVTCMAFSLMEDEDVELNKPFATGCLPDGRNMPVAVTVPRPVS